MAEQREAALVRGHSARDPFAALRRMMTPELDRLRTTVRNGLRVAVTALDGDAGGREGRGQAARDPD